MLRFLTKLADKLDERRLARRYRRAVAARKFLLERVEQMKAPRG